jgi:hypothetical protein
VVTRASYYPINLYIYFTTGTKPSEISIAKFLVDEPDFKNNFKIIRIPSNGTASPIYDLYFVTAGKTWPNMTIYPIFKPEYLSDYTIEMQNNNFTPGNLSGTLIGTSVKANKIE